jgi:hypothetical protein
MIRKTYISIALFLLVSGLVNARMQFVPYYNYQFIEGVSVSPEGDTGFTVSLSNDIGAIFKPINAHSFIGFYSLKYQGPGLKKQEGQEFSERFLDHLFVGRHHWEIGGGITLKSQIDFLLEARRSGTNEDWENGLYNFNRYGGNTALNRELFGIDFTGTFKYHFMSFPNYTDMLAELRSGADPSVSEGKQNHHISGISIKGIYKKNAAWLDIATQLYTKQNVAVNTVQSNGTFYSSDKQKDMNITIGASHMEALSRKSVINPSLEFSMKNSNQNYQHFAEVTSTAPVSFHADYNDYVNIVFDCPFSLALSRKWTLMLSPEFNYKKYSSRTTRDDLGIFTDEKQSRLLSIFMVGFKKQIGESSSSMLFCTIQSQSSNMDFERYVSYNYTGFTAGFKFQMEY